MRLGAEGQRACVSLGLRELGVEGFLGFAL